MLKKVLRPFGRYFWGAPFLVLFLTVCSRALGFVRELVVAALLGANSDSDALVTAILLSNAVTGTLADPGANALLPVYVEVRERAGTAEARSLARTAIGVFGLGLLLTTGTTAWFAPTAITAYLGSLDPKIMGVAVLSTRVVLLGTLCFGLESVTRALLNADGRWGVTGFSPVLQNIVTIAGILALYHFRVVGLSIAIALGMASVLAVELLVLCRSGSLVARGDFSPHLTRVLNGAVPLMATALVGQVSIMVDRHMASRLQAGAVSVLSYADKIRQLPVGVVFAIASAVFYPAISRHASRGNIDAVRQEVVRITSFVLLPVAAGAGLLMCFATPFTRLVFERGAFDAAATAETSMALMWYAPGLVLISAGHVLSYTLWSIGVTKASLLVESVCLAFRVIALTWSAPRYGLAGVAAVDGLTHMARVGLLMLFYRRQIRLRQIAATPSRGG